MPINTMLNDFKGKTALWMKEDMKQFIKIQHAENRYRLGESASTIKPKSVDIGPSGIFFNLPPLKGSYLVTFDWAQYSDMFRFSDNVDNLVYKVQFSDSKFFQFSYPTYKVLGFPKHAKSANLEIYDRKGADDKMKVRFFKCYGDFEVEILTKKSGDNKPIPFESFYLRSSDDQSPRSVSLTSDYIEKLLIDITKAKRLEDGEIIEHSNNWKAMSMTVTKDYEDIHKHTVEDGKLLGVSFSGNKATFKIKQTSINWENSSEFKNDISYNFIISKNPIIVDYFMGCGETNI